MRWYIKNIHKNYENAKEKTAVLLQQLTAKATILEKLKAKVGIATSLSAFLQLNELSDEEEEEDDLLKEGGRIYSKPFPFRVIHLHTSVCGPLRMGKG